MAQPARAGSGVDISAASWSEPDWCADRTSLDDVRASYRPETLKATLIEIAKRRYPPAVAVLERASERDLSMYLQGLPGDQQDEFFLAVGMFPLVAHEEGHWWDASHASPGAAYRFFDGRVYRTAAIRTFPRAEILTRHPNRSADEYEELYLRGGSGKQGINMLLEEFVQYVHQLAAAHCTIDFDPTLADLDPSLAEPEYIGDRDGVLTFMWYVETYLAIAREEHPRDYRKIIKARGLRTAILDTWRRAEYWLVRTTPAPPGTISAELEQRIREPQNLREIQLLANR